MTIDVLKTWGWIVLASVVLTVFCWLFCIVRRRRSVAIEERFDYEFAIPFMDMISADRFVSSSYWLPLVERTRGLYEHIASSRHQFLASTKAAITEYERAEQTIIEHNDRYCENELKRNAKYFDTLADYPLDVQQRQACVRDENASLVIAGAGSGKTSVIVAKVAYLIEVKKVDAKDILLLTFAKKAAKEMSDRVAKRLGENTVLATTFHSFGSKLILRLGKHRHSIASERLLYSVVHELFTGSRSFTPEGYENILAYCTYYFDPEHETRDGDGEISVAAREIGEKVTYRGEVVKSLEEAMIANFLFLNKVDYCYEMAYAKPYERDGVHVDYHPDFYLPEYDIYIEHFGVDKTGEPPSSYSEEERRAYKEGMIWKRRVHRKNSTTLVESYSWWNQDRRLCENLRKALEAQGVHFVPLDGADVLEMVRKKAGSRIAGFEEMLVTFISLFKSKGYGIEKLDTLAYDIAGDSYLCNRTRSFLQLAKDVYRNYEQELSDRGEYDFDDMIIEATRLLISSPRRTLGYKYVIVDEFQDISMSRAMLLKEILAQSGARLFCVGDDWQSIYRFAGSDIHIFTEFGKYFGYHDRLHLDCTYRNSQELIDLMGAFVSENKGQISKNLRSAKRCAKPIVGIVYENRKSGSIANKARALDEAIRRIADETDGCATTVLLLGRHSVEVSIANAAETLIKSFGDTYRVVGHANIEVRFLTVHKAKGSEADYVVLLNAEDGTYGFPNQIADDPLVQLVLAKPERYPFAEERRLFYVAMTRTRNRTYILEPKQKVSSFILDLRTLMKAKKSLGGIADQKALTESV